ncbi:uncharacterized protein YndB with AHSA1/START domain [Sphingomonas sp. UYAg733]
MTHDHDDGGVPGPMISLTRIFNAPRDLVYRLWTDPGYVSLWWGIAGATNPVCEMDVRPGGKWRIHMRTASGTIYPNEFVFLDVIENERLVYSDTQNADSPALSPSRPLGVMVHTVTFEDDGARTRVVLQTCFASPEDRERLVAAGFRNGIGESLDRFQLLLEDIERGDINSPDLAVAG